ncbi:MAG: RNA polymerase sigma factor [Saprospiraceae bacterium]
MLAESQIIERCKISDPVAQKLLYTKYKGLFYAICIRYLTDPMEAEDALVEAFYKIFTKINGYSGGGSFEGWMKRILVNECLMKIRKSNNFRLHVDIENAYDLGNEADVISKLSFDELISLMNELPKGYKTVFNLYVLEGYKHREIAKLLDISINTSKSQLILAKKRMQELIKKKHDLKIS